MARFFIQLSYDGSAYNGWQIQENTPHTVQQVLQEKLSLLLKESIAITGCGRTDTGVHARNYVAHFDSNCPDLITNKKHWLYKFNVLLPTDVSIENIWAVHYNAHARFSAINRSYYYFVHQQKNPFIDNFSHYVYGEIDFERMNKAAAILKEYKEFSSFGKSNTQTKTNLCKIYRAEWQKCGEEQWRFRITADRFLRGMVRAIVGTLLLVGRHKISIDEFKKIIESKDRKMAGENAPAKALFFTGVNYPESIYEK